MLPPMLDETGFTSWRRVINLMDIILVVVAFLLLSARPPRSLLNLWLMVVMGYWFCDGYGRDQSVVAARSSMLPVITGADNWFWKPKG
jgi:hypothetical protein